MATDKSKKTNQKGSSHQDDDPQKAPAKGNKMHKITEKLFADLGTLATEEAPAESQKKNRKKTQKNVPSLAESEEMESRRESTMLRSRIRELEAQDKAKTKVPHVPAIVYEREQIAYAFEKDTLKSIKPASPDLKPKNPLEAPLTATGKTIGSMFLDAPEGKEWQPEEEDLLKNIAQQASLQIQSLRLLSSAERARLEAEEATRQFMHKNWDNYLDAIHQSEKIGYLR